jgi:PP-loop superfamily ATP-utilizing enzyme
VKYAILSSTRRSNSGAIVNGGVNKTHPACNEHRVSAASKDSHRATFCEEAIYNVLPEEASATGDECIHGK